MGDSHGIGVAPAAAGRDGGRIRNAGELTSHGQVARRAVVVEIAAAGLAACDPGPATERAVRLDGDRLVVDGHPYPLGPTTRVLVVGAGKASLPIAEALERLLGERIAGGAVVVRGDQEESANLERIETVVADHPVPSARSAAAGKRLLTEVAAAGPDDVVIACFTGGSSALASLPPPAVAIEEKAALNELLLRSGLPIVAVNAVRKHVSMLKGGRLAAAVAPARLINLTVSDVAGDPLDAITDPTVEDTTTPEEAVEILRAAWLWEDVPESIRAHLVTPDSRSPHPIGDAQTVVLADGALACDAMALAAAERGFSPIVLSRSLEGEARELGRFLVNLAKESGVDGSPFSPPCLLIGCGGEARVSLGSRDQLGRGGPNQEAALAAALELDGELGVAAVFLDTDGSDGGTDIAGAVVDGQTAARARALRIDVRRALREHRTSAALVELDDAIVTGPTRTNVNDLFAIAVVSQDRERPGT